MTTPFRKVLPAATSAPCAPASRAAAWAGTQFDLVPLSVQTPQQIIIKQLLHEGLGGARAEAGLQLDAGQALQQADGQDQHCMRCLGADWELASGQALQEEDEQGHLGAGLQAICAWPAGAGCAAASRLSSAGG